MLFIIIRYSAVAQSVSADSLVVMTGHVYNSQTNKPVKGRLTFEKLPYGDDLGIAKSDTTGFFQMSLINNNKYSVNIKATGYLAYKEELVVSASGKKIIKNKNYYLIPNAVGQVLRIKNLYFEQSTSVIPDDAFVELNIIVRMLKENPTMTIQLEGHTDFRGNSSLNLKLSQQRVKIIKNYIILKGIDKNRIKLKAFGGTMPLRKEETEEAKKTNRRVEVRILKL